MFNRFIGPFKNKFFLFGSVLGLFLIPLVVYSVSQRTNLFSNASIVRQITFVNPQTFQIIESTTVATVGVMLDAPWPIAEIREGMVAGLMAQKNPVDNGGGGGKSTNPPAPGGGGKTTPATTPLTSSSPVQVTASIVLAQDQNFTQNVQTVSPVPSDPYITTYTFSDNSLGTKTLFAKFVSSTGSNQVFSKSIQLVSSTSTSPTSAPPVTGGTGGGTRPYPNAPLCPDTGAVHNNSTFHTLWDSTRGCHYDHEHGTNPFTPAVAAAFPGFDLFRLLGGVQIGHTNPSSPVENTSKHGGFKWQVDTASPNGQLEVCQQGFEGGTVAVKGYAIQYHEFGRQDIEHEARNHSSLSLISLCKNGNPNDVGYIYNVQLQEYGQRITPYQGYILPYPNNFTPLYISPRGPYLTNECVGANIPLPNITLSNGQTVPMSNTNTVCTCRPSRAGHVAERGNVNSIWTSKPTGSGMRPRTPQLFRLLFRIRDGYQLMDSSDLVHPFTWVWMCSSNNGQAYNGAMPGCRWNNTTATINEVMGDIPAAWDGLAGFDTDSRPGRITADGFTTQFGELRRDCIAPRSSTADDAGCYPLKLIGAFVGTYSSELSVDKVSNPDPTNLPERDIYFCNGVACSETSAGAVPSGWVSENN